MDNKPEIANVAIPLPVDMLFDYYIPKRLSQRVQVGMRVCVEFNRKYIIGYVINCPSKSKFKKLKPIIDVLDSAPILTANTLKLAKKIKDYYVCSLGQALESMLPNTLKRTKTINVNFIINLQKKTFKETNVVYLQSLLESATYNYLRQEIIERINNKKRIILVIPEIGRIKAAVEYFSSIPEIKLGIWHGRIPKESMIDLWDDLACDKIDLIIGSRSCIFAPISNLDLVIIEDEGNTSHKDDQVPYYHSIKIAQMRSDIEYCDIILTSLVPCAQTYQLISKKKIISKVLNTDKSLADVQFSKANYKDKIDIMIERDIESALEKKEKILIFLNRKGFATFIYCSKCNNSLKCNRCSSNLIFDYSKKVLICPYCNFKTEFVEICPTCNCAYVKFRGLGVEKLQSNLKRVFPAAKIISIEEFSKGSDTTANFDILVATKKVINFTDICPDITIVWNLDSMLNIGDFHSAENTYQLLSKLLLMSKKKMIICSGLNPDFYILRSLKNLNYKEFYRYELKARNELNLPPYYHIGLISIRSLQRKSVENISSRIQSYFESLRIKNIKTTDAYQTLHPRLRGKYYRYVLVKSKDFDLLNSVLKKTLEKFRSNKVIITVNIDPV